jgi:hypothetical protein
MYTPTLWYIDENGDSTDMGALPLNACPWRYQRLAQRELLAECETEEQMKEIDAGQFVWR